MTKNFPNPFRVVLLLPALLFLSKTEPPAEAQRVPSTKANSPTAKSKIAPQAELTRLRYNRDIRPILAENCFACHGPDSAARQAGLRLDKFETATADRGGVSPIVKGHPEKSAVWRRTTGKGAIMPPVGGGRKPLSAKQISMLKTWIAQGAEYELHWAYQTPKRTSLPTVSAKNAKWVQTPLDRFILARLEASGLDPAPRADRRTLARRLSLDLTGLPPEPSEVESFVEDTAPNAYEKLVDHYLASPQWGEHRGRYWLDAARYADTHGIHFDNYREIWSYRDWIIKALNKNMPFDQFTIEQLAGDLLPNHTLDQVIATGFNRCNITTNEGGAIDEEYKVLYARDRTETTSQVWLGSTLGCAVCHDHKFDPFTQKDFYSFSAFFNNTTQAAMDGNISSTPPIMVVPKDEDRDRYNRVKSEFETVRKSVEDRKQAARADFNPWLLKANTTSISTKIPAERLQFHAPLDEGQGREVKADFEGKPLKLVSATEAGWEAGQVSAKAYTRKSGNTLEAAKAGDFEKSDSFSCAVWVKIPTGDTGGAIVARMDNEHDFRGWDLWIQGGKLATHIIHKWPENALKTVAMDSLSPGKWHHLCMTYAGGGNTASVRLYIDGVAQKTGDEANALKDTIKTEVPLKIGQRHSTAGVDGTAIQDVRVYGKVLTPEEVSALATGTRLNYLVSHGATALTTPEKDELFDWWLNKSDLSYRTLYAQLNTLDTENKAILAAGTKAYVMQERSEDAEAFILARGEYDKRKDPVKPLPPTFLPSLPSDAPKNRLGLAQWLMRPENPLTARVTVNRFWQEIFGQGLVSSSGDFGVTGTLPTHPELLDWMAVEFRETGWDIKRFFKMMVMSSTYRQSSVITPEKARKDPKNLLLSRGVRFRMDAEMVRDYVLATSGLLVKKIGGPSVKPYQPEGVWEAVAMLESNTHFYKRDMGENLYRRSLYTFWKRAAPPASLDLFNAPSRETCTVRRERTNTPMQALVTLNDVQYVEAARYLAQRALRGVTKNSPVEEGRSLDFLAQRLLSRSFRPEEVTVVKKSLSDLISFYKGHTKEANELISVGESKPDANLKPELLAAWTMLTNQLMNLDEVLNK